jgi:hypothetical protein
VSMLFSLLALGFVAAQGAVIFVTAWLVLRSAGTRHFAAKIGIMILSWGAWCFATIFGYGLLGGEGGLMDGFGLVLSLCASALASSCLYLLAWLILPLVFPEPKECDR